jgi:U3 small nucleolar ribonucleoprotein protein IMP4
MDIPKLPEGSAFENVLVIREDDENNRAVMEFYGSNGMETGPKIFVKEWRS